MADIKDIIKSKLSSMEEPSLPKFGWDNPQYAELEEPAKNVIASYQNANRWLDTIKEHILINLNLPYFSDIVHQVAHMMPKRFDKFGDILHTRKLEVPYPSTEAWHDSIGDIENVFSIIYKILDAIQDSIIEFKNVAERTHCIDLSIRCDNLLVEITDDYQKFFTMEGQLDYYRTNLALWDKSTKYYWNPEEITK